MKNENWNRRQILSGLFGTVLLAPALSAEAAPPPGGGSLAGLSMRAGQAWQSGTIKLVYFGLANSSTCGSDLDSITSILTRPGLDAAKVTPVFVYPRFNGQEPNMTRFSPILTVRSNPRFLEVYGTPEQIDAAAAKYRASYFDIFKNPITLASGTEPFNHTHYAYVMGPDMTLIKPVPASRFLTDLEPALQNAVAKYIPEGPGLYR